MANLSNINNKFLVTTGGDVGIGTTSPRSKLEVNGGIMMQNGENLEWGDTYANNAPTIFASTNYLQFAPTGASGVASNSMKLTTTGLGVGTTSPAVSLDVNAGTSDTIARFESTDNRGRIQIDDNDTTVYAIAEGSKMSLGTSNTLSSTNLTIDSSGQVGIGETSPLADLHVRDSGQNSNITDTVPSWWNGLFERTYTTTSNAAIGIVGSTQALGSGGVIYLGYSDDVDNNWIGVLSSQAMTFGTNTVERMRIDSSGNVGIGRTDPNARLDIKGAGTTTGLTFETSDASNNQTFYIQDGGRAGLQYYPFTIGMASGTSAATGARFQVANTGGDFVVMNDGKTGIGTTSPLSKFDLRGTAYITGYTVGFDTSPQGNYAYRLTNDGANSFINVLGGNLGIGTTAPAYKLDVNGGIRLNGKSALTDNGYFIGAPSYGFRWNNNADTFNNVIMYDNGNMYVRGNVGIGTTSPSVPLEISKSGARIKLIDGTNQLNIGLWDGVNYRFEGDANRPLYFTSYQGNIKLGISGGTTMTVQSSNVGIGTTSPSQALDVNGYIKATNEGAGYVQGVFVAHSSTLDTPSYRGQGYFTYNEGHDVSWFMGTPYTNGDFFCINRQHSTTSFDTAAAYIGNANTDNFFSITNAGNVGIGTVSPSAKLEIVGSNGTNIFRGNFGGSADIFMGFDNANPYLTLQDNSNVTTHLFQSNVNNYIVNSNVGIGTTSPSAKLHVSGTGNQGVQAWFGNGFVNNSLYHYDFARVGFSVEDQDGADTGAGFHFNTRNSADTNWLHGYIYQPQNGGIAFGTGGAGTTVATEKMRITSAGEVVVNDGINYGANPPTHRGSIILAGASAPTNFGGIEFHTNSGGGAGYGTKIYSSDATWGIATRNNSTTFTTRFEISGSTGNAYFTGNLGIGVTSPSDKLEATTSASQYTGRFDYTGSSGGAYGCLKLRISANTSPSFIDLFYDGYSTNPLSPVGAIVTTGSAVLYSSFSDYRLKENVANLTGALDRVNSLQPKTFNYINRPETTNEGFLAHELQEIVPQAVSGTKDGVDEQGNPKYQGVDNAHLVPLLVGAIKELEARVKELENK